MNENNPDDETGGSPGTRKRSLPQKMLWLIILIAWAVMMIGFAVELPRYLHFAQ